MNNWLNVFLETLLGVNYLPETKEQKAIRELQQMSDKELDDIGVKRVEIRERVYGRDQHEHV